MWNCPALNTSNLSMWYSREYMARKSGFGNSIIYAMACRAEDVRCPPSNIHYPLRHAICNFVIVSSAFSFSAPPISSLVTSYHSIKAAKPKYVRLTDPPPKSPTFGKIVKSKECKPEKCSKLVFPSHRSTQYTPITRRKRVIRSTPGGKNCLIGTSTIPYRYGL